MALLAASGLASYPQLIFLLFAGAVWLVNILARAKAARPGPAPGHVTPGEPDRGAPEAPVAQESEAEERARRVREEILRKIAERHPAATPRDLRSIIKEAYERREPVGGFAKTGFPAAPATMPAGPAFPPVASPAGAPPAGPQARPAGAVWLEELRSHDSARRAILVREILGPPIALR
jgi:hypothetical protein